MAYFNTLMLSSVSGCFVKQMSRCSTVILTAYSPYYRKGRKGTQPGSLEMKIKGLSEGIRFISVNVIKEI
ncbi:hypothetical protein ETA10_04545 [Bacillus subtilis]|nr:hypothetical protein ETA10_04545 [Bacillus subtilis]